MRVTATAMKDDQKYVVELHDAAVAAIEAILPLYAVRKLRVHYGPQVGALQTHTMHMEPEPALDAMLPAPVKESRSEVLRGFAPLMYVTGVAEVTVEYDESDKLLITGKYKEMYERLNNIKGAANGQ